MFQGDAETLSTLLGSKSTFHKLWLKKIWDEFSVYVEKVYNTCQVTECFGEERISIFHRLVHVVLVLRLKE